MRGYFVGGWFIIHTLCHSTVCVCVCCCTPGRRGHIDGCFGVVVSIVETPEELCTHLQSTCTTQTLDSAHLAMTERQLV